MRNSLLLLLVAAGAANFFNFAVLKHNFLSVMLPDHSQATELLDFNVAERQKTEVAGAEAASSRRLQVQKHTAAHLGVVDHQIPTWMEAYVKFHNDRVVVGVNTGRAYLKPGTKYLKYSCTNWCGGVGDRFNGILSLFYVAMLSDRVFLIDHKTPRPLTDVLVPNRFRWDAAVVDVIPAYDTGTATAASTTGRRTSTRGEDTGEAPTADATKNTTSFRYYRATNSGYYPFIYDPCLLKTDESNDDGGGEEKGNSTTDADAMGIASQVNRWWGESATWESECMQNYVSKHSVDRDRYDPKHRHMMSRWAFWTLFRFGDDVLDRASELKIHAGLDPDEPYLGVHVRAERHKTDEDHHEFYDCAKKFQARILLLEEQKQRQRLKQQQQKNTPRSMVDTNAAAMKTKPRCIFVADDSYPEEKHHHMINGSSNVKQKIQAWDRSSGTGGTVRISTDIQVIHTELTNRSLLTNNVGPREAFIDTYAELVMLLDSECLVSSRSGFSSVPFRIGVSNTDYRDNGRKCGVQFNKCTVDAVDASINLLDWDLRSGTSPPSSGKISSSTERKTSSTPSKAVVASTTTQKSKLLPKMMDYQRRGVALLTVFDFPHNRNFTGRCSCRNIQAADDEQHKCCTRGLFRSHKFEPMIRGGLFSQYKPKVKRYGAHDMPDYLKSMPSYDYRDVLVFRNIYDALVSGYLYHKSGRECTKDIHGNYLPPESNRFFRIRDWYRYLSYDADLANPPRNNRTLCQFIEDESPEAGMRAYMDSIFHSQYQVQFDRYAISREIPEFKERTFTICYEHLKSSEQANTVLTEAARFYYDNDSGVVVEPWTSGAPGSATAETSHGTSKDRDVRSHLRGVVDRIDRTHYNGDIAWVDSILPC